MAAWFVVDEPMELPALLRALYAAKFYAPADGPELAGSPILARLLERAMEAFNAAEDAGLLGRRIGPRPDSLSLPGPDIVESVRNHLVEVVNRRRAWAEWSLDERADYVRVVFRPYIPDEALLRELTTAGDQRGSADKLR